MRTKEQSLAEFSRLIPFVESLRQLNESEWTTPIAEGKWTVRDIVAHLMLWDRYFYEEAVEKAANRQPLTVRHLDDDEFNRGAVAFAETKGMQEIIDRTVHWRDQIVRCLELLPEDEFGKEHADRDGRPFSINHYLTDFIPHDAHHIGQIQAFLAGSALGEKNSAG